jgi:chromosome segregation ATPase
MATLRSDLSKRDDLVEQTRIKKESLERLQIEKNDLELHLNTLLRQINAATDKTVRLERSQGERREAFSSRLDSLRSQHTSVSEERARVTAIVDSNERAIKEAETRIAEIKRVHEAEMVALRADCVTLKARVSGYAGEVKKFLISS